MGLEQKFMAYAAASARAWESPRLGAGRFTQKLNFRAPAAAQRHTTAETNLFDGRRKREVALSEESGKGSPASLEDSNVR